MNYLFENQSVSLLSELPFNKIDLDKVLSPIAFFYEAIGDGLDESESMLLTKIISSIGQTSDSTLLIDLKKFRFTLNDLQAYGISKIVVCSDYKVSQFLSINYKIDTPFSLAGIQFYPTASFSTLDKQPDLKKKLWSFLNS